MNYKYLFGPVPSRRLGLSLGIDLVPHKTCSLNCVYCECGKTTELTLDRKEYIPFDGIITELKNYLSTDPSVDYLTFSGSGEPTLYSRLGEVVSFIKKDFSKYKIALLTNSTLLKDKMLQKEIEQIDVVIPSLDAVSEEVFQKINHPVSGLKSSDILSGLSDFKLNYKGEIWVEIFIISGINDFPEELNLFREYLTALAPDKIQLNSLDRPGTESWVKKSSFENLERIRKFFQPLEVEIVAKFQNTTRTFFEKENMENKILSMISRRPCTKEDISETTGLKLSEIEKYLNELLEKNKIKFIKEERGIFYRVK